MEEIQNFGSIFIFPFGRSKPRGTISQARMAICVVGPAAVLLPVLLFTNKHNQTLFAWRRNLASTRREALFRRKQKKMTYNSRGRSIAEVIVAAIFIGFLTGFVAVLCIGNYFRAKKAMERQRQRRLARLSHGGGATDSPRSHYSSTTSGGSTAGTDEHQHLLARPPEIPRRRNNDVNDLLLFSENERQNKPNISRV